MNATAPTAMVSGSPRGGGFACRRRRRSPRVTAGSAAAFAVAVGDVLPALRVPLRASASVVAFSRVYTGVHYPGDVLVGAAVGTVIGRLTSAYGAPRALASDGRAEDGLIGREKRRGAIGVTSELSALGARNCCRLALPPHSRPISPDMGDTTASFRESNQTEIGPDDRT